MLVGNMARQGLRMKILAMDIETDALDATKIHVICAQDVDTNEKYQFLNVCTVPEEREAFFLLCQQTDKFIFHNGIGFDVKVINRLLNPLLIAYPEIIKPTDVILRLTCIDRLYGNMPGYKANFYEYETNTLVKSSTAFKEEVMYFSYLPEYTLGLTVTSDGYLPHSLRVDPDLEYKTTDQIEKIIFLDRSQNTSMDNLSEKNISTAISSTARPDDVENSSTSNASRPVVLKNIFFEFDSDSLSPASKREIGLVFNSQKNAKRLTIVGHTDSKGPATYNQRLSEKRARQVEEYIYSLGFTGEIKSIGMGESKPIATNETEKGRSQNRRSEITITY